MSKKHTTFNSRILKRMMCAAAAVLLMGGSRALAQTIRLRGEMKAEVKQTVRLGDVATVSGTDAKTAEGLLNLVILPELPAGRSVRAEAVLMAVVAQIGPGALADGLQMSGAAACDIQIGNKPAPNKVQPKKIAAAPALPLAPANSPTAPVLTLASGSPSKADPRPVTENRGPTLAKLLVEQLTQDLGAKVEDLRINFDTVNPLLDQAAPAGRKWAIRPLARTLLGTVQFEAQLIEGSRVVQKLSIQMHVQKRETVLVASGPILRGDVVMKSHFKAEETWSDRKMPTLLTNEKDVIGLEATRDVAAGSNLDQRDFRPITMAARGEVVSVIFMTGNLKVQMKARAVTEGKLHESIQVKNESNNDVYDAVLIGKHLAVVGAIDEAQEKKLREAR